MLRDLRDQRGSLIRCFEAAHVRRGPMNARPCCPPWMRLFAARLQVPLDPADDRQNIADLAMDQMAAVELGGELR